MGLSVDYSLHIGHAFLTSTGTRLERAHNALATMGVSVFNGGTATFLAVATLGAAQGLIFQTFFKCFAFTVLFGLYHGLVLFPVLLALGGSKAYADRGAGQPHAAPTGGGALKAAPATVAQVPGPAPLPV